MAQDADTRGLARAGIAVVLTFVAGYVDALGWLTLDHVFTAQMSGNTVQLAIRLATGDGNPWLQADSMAAFFSGLVLSGTIIEIGMRQRVRRILVAALIVEFVLLVVFAVAGSLRPPGGGGREVYLLIAAVAFAMGTQNTSLRMAGILSVFTTHLTGALSSLSEELIVCCFALLQPNRHRRRDGGFASDTLRAKHPKAFRNAVRSAALLVGFFAGALAGAALFRPVGLAAAMIVPLLLLAGAGIYDWLAPLTVFPSAAEQE